MAFSAPLRQEFYTSNMHAVRMSEAADTRAALCVPRRSGCISFNTGMCCGHMIYELILASALHIRLVKRNARSPRCACPDSLHLQPIPLRAPIPSHL